MCLGPCRTIWYELQARDWPFKNQAAEALIWQIGSGEGTKRLLASISLGKEVSVSSCLLSGSAAQSLGRVLRAGVNLHAPRGVSGSCPSSGPNGSFLLTHTLGAAGATHRRSSLYSGFNLAVVGI